MSDVAAEPAPSRPVDAFVIGGPVGRIETHLLPIARLAELFTERDDRPPILPPVAKLAAIVVGVGGSLAAGALGLTFSVARLFR
jgi:hypothetical protein